MNFIAHYDVIYQDKKIWTASLNLWVNIDPSSLTRNSSLNIRLMPEKN